VQPADARQLIAGAPSLLRAAASAGG